MGRRSDASPFLLCANLKRAGARLCRTPEKRIPRSRAPLRREPAFRKKILTAKPHAVLMRLAGADGGGGEFGLLANGRRKGSAAAGKFLDCGHVLRLADEVERAQGFKDFVGAGIDEQHGLARGNR